ncbi:DUF5320 domain-containing protein [Acetobacterium sp.]|uniref:DUF5320 domain-containing protein n=1 Tax=Acetobacterium sp. TaxID=1872094 RepID=UPI0035942058
MPGRDGTGPMGDGSVGGRGGSGSGRGRGGCRNSGGKNNRFVNNRFGDPYCRRWDNSNPNDVSVLKNQAEYYEKQLEAINQRISSLDVDQQVIED